MPEIWRLLIVHRTVLTYPDTVTTSYNEVRMQPSDEPGQAVLSARLEIDPFEGVLSYIDYFGTRVVGVRHPPAAPAPRRHRHHHRRDLPAGGELAGAVPPADRRRRAGDRADELGGLAELATATTGSRSSSPRPR